MFLFYFISIHFPKVFSSLVLRRDENGINKKNKRKNNNLSKINENLFI